MQSASETWDKEEPGRWGPGPGGGPCGGPWRGTDFIKCCSGSAALINWKGMPVDSPRPRSLRFLLCTRGGCRVRKASPGPGKPDEGVPPKVLAPSRRAGPATRGRAPGTTLPRIPFAAAILGWEVAAGVWPFWPPGGLGSPSSLPALRGSGPRRGGRERKRGGLGRSCPPPPLRSRGPRVCPRREAGSPPAGQRQ